MTQFDATVDQGGTMIDIYQLVIHNDNHHSVDYVQRLLSELLHDKQKAIMHTHAIQHSGRTITHFGSKEYIEFIVDRINSAPSDKYDDRTIIQPLRTSIIRLH